MRPQMFRFACSLLLAFFATGGETGLGAVDEVSMAMRIIPNHPEDSGTIPGPVIQIDSRQGESGVHVRVTDLGGNKDCVVSKVVFEVLGPGQKIETLGISSDLLHPSRSMDLKYSQLGAHSVRAFGECDSSKTKYSNTIAWGIDGAGSRAWTNFKAPLNVQQVDIKSTAGISLTWEEPEGPQAEYYSARCFLSTDPEFISPVYCAASNPVAAVDKIPPKTEFATLTNLKPSTLYRCFVIAMDEDHWRCSDSVLVDYHSYGTCDPETVNEEKSEARLGTCGTHNGTAQDVQGARTAQLRAYGLEIVDMSGTTIQRKIESFPGATIPLHFKICLRNTSEIDMVEDAISKQIEVMDQAFAEAKITFTKGETVFCADEDKELVATKCDLDREKLLENQEILDYLDQYDLPATEEYAEQAAAENCASAAFAIDGVTGLTGGITNIILRTPFFLGVSSSLGLYIPSAPPLLLLSHDSLPDVVPNTRASLGMTLPHEMGHKLGLLHPWEEADYPEDPDGAVVENLDSCLEERDPMPSTPITKEDISGCQVGSDTCPGKPGRDPINNIMGYSDDCCMSVFTMEQIVLMQANILTYAPFWLNA